jgi:hypothetical protein
VARIELDDFYLKWVEKNVRPVLKRYDVLLTDSAKELLAYALQAQVKDRFLPDRDRVVRSAEELLRLLESSYRPPFLLPPPIARPLPGELNFNVALHLMVELNRVALAFPWHTTD